MELNSQQERPPESNPSPVKPENRARAALKALGSAALGFGKAQVILFGVNFCVVTIGMLVVGMKWWSPLIAVGVSLLDLLPVIGSGIVFVPWAVIALLAKNPHMAIAVGATYIAMVVLRMVLDPIITGKNIGLPPILTLLAVANILFRVFFPKKAAKKASPAKRAPHERLAACCSLAAWAPSRAP